ncbi:uncharacterized protein LY89DRAFT_229665 [Mollisia scopiformis]|uniref:DUF7707 domain-containing protein n=1 Tax=Mollisia scopiformis TaxID=149040 RepID=A0A194WUP0_MOLSC|nr:uncharacterized protein LY89DRAFT_229665 [Mollisia scopiformis]KUJ11681.1 hypothetical protein LY89DRAFT_229665 [Mollisia scopiformis]
MPRMRATLICLLFIFTGVANAQLGANSTIDPSTVSATVRSQWCEAQINTCGVLCSGDANTNTCDTTTLDYGCTCASNSSAPGLLYYTETIPTYCCEQNYANCISAASGDASAQATCQQNEKTNCGHLDPANFTAVPVASASTSSATQQPRLANQVAHYARRQRARQVQALRPIPRNKQTLEPLLPPTQVPTQIMVFRRAQRQESESELHSAHFS